MVNTRSALEANTSRKDLVVSRSNLGNVFRPEGPRHTRVSITSAFNIRTFRLRGAVVLPHNSAPNRLRHARMNERDPSVDFEREVSVFMDNAAY